MSFVSTSTSKITLIPWDPASPEHIQRMVQQRVACGWNEKDVEGWRAAQESGELNIQWIVLEDSDPDKHVKLLKHAEAFPQEQEPLIDSAISFGGKSRTILLPQRSFNPVGHISLGRVPSAYKNSEFANNEEASYWISSLYVSRALQGNGLGRAAMDAIEKMAISEPLCAKTLALNTIKKDDPEREEEKYKAFGRTVPQISTQEWYIRRGYQAYDHAEKLYSDVDSTGKTWYWDAVFLKKDI